MVPLLDTIRFHAINCLAASDGIHDLHDLVPDNHLVYDREETNAKGRVNPITTRKYQVNQNKALKAYARMVLDFDRDQLQAFFDLNKAPFGMIFIEGCAGSGKTTVANLIASIIQDSGVVPVSSGIS